MKITVLDLPGRQYSLEMESTDTIAHLAAKMEVVLGTRHDTQRYLFHGKQLRWNMRLADVGIQKGSLLHLRLRLRGGGAGEIERIRQLENDGFYDADAFKSGWREEHGKVLLGLLLQLCQDGIISEGNIGDKAWLRIKKGLKKSTKSSFEIDFLKARLEDYKQLYSLLANPSSQVFRWDRENKTILIASVWREYHPELSVLCGAYIPYFDTLEEVCLLLCTGRSVSETSININNENSARLRRDFRGPMKIFVGNLARAFYLECEPTDTIACLKAKVYTVEDIPPYEQRLLIDGILLSDDFPENKTLAKMGIQNQSKFHRVFLLRCRGRGEFGRPPPEKGYLYYADAFKYGWTEENCEVFLCLLLQLCQDGTISEGNISDNAWLRIQNDLKNSTNCSFQIDFLKDRLCDYKQLYSLLVETSSPNFSWDCEEKTVRRERGWWEHHPELFLVCTRAAGKEQKFFDTLIIPYFDTLEEVCLLLNSRRSSKQQVSETLSSINNVKVVHQDIPRLSNARPNKFSLKRLFMCFI